MSGGQVTVEVVVRDGEEVFSVTPIALPPAAPVEPIDPPPVQPIDPGQAAHKLRHNGAIVGWPQSAHQVGNHRIGRLGSAPGDGRKHRIAWRFRCRYPGKLKGIGWFLRVTNEKYYTASPAAPGRYSSGNGGRYRIEVRRAVDGDNPKQARPDMSASGLIGLTAANGGYTGAIQETQSNGKVKVDWRGRKRDIRSQVPASDKFTAEPVPSQGGRELWPLERCDSPLTLNETYFLVWANEDPKCCDDLETGNYCSNNNWFLNPPVDQMDGDPYDPAWQGPWATAFMHSFENRNGGEGAWAIEDYSQQVMDLLLLYEDGVGIGPSSFGAEYINAKQKLSSADRIRMAWTQPDTIEVDRFCTHLAARAGGLATLKLAVRAVGGDDVVTFELDGGKVPAQAVEKTGKPVPFTYWPLPPFTFRRGEKYEATLWCAEGSCMANFIGRPDFPHRDGALGEASKSSDGGKSWNRQGLTSKQWPLAWIRTGVEVPLVNA